MKREKYEADLDQTERHNGDQRDVSQIHSAFGRSDAVSRAAARKLRGPVWLSKPLSGARRGTSYIAVLARRAQDEGAPPGLKSCFESLARSNRGLQHDRATGGKPSSGLLSGRYQVLEVLGRGTYALTCGAMDKFTGERVAIKCFQGHNRDVGRQEQLFLAHMKSRGYGRRHGLLQVHCYFEDNEADITGIVCERLYQSLSDCRPFMSKASSERERGLQKLCFQLFAALASVHETGLLHGDVRPENILLRRPVARCTASSLPCALIDFSNCLPRGHCDQHRMEGVDVGTLSYRSPEALFRCPFNEKADVWSAGMVIMELITSQEESDDETHDSHRQTDTLIDWSDECSAVSSLAKWFGKLPLQQFDSSRDGDEGPLKTDLLESCRNCFADVSAEEVSRRHCKMWVLAATISPLFCSMMRQILHFDPSQRMSAGSVLRHPFVAKLLPFSPTADGEEKSKFQEQCNLSVNRLHSLSAKYQKTAASKLILDTTSAKLSSVPLTPVKSEVASKSRSNASNNARKRVRSSSTGAGRESKIKTKSRNKFMMANSESSDELGDQGKEATLNGSNSIAEKTPDSGPDAEADDEPFAFSPLRRNARGNARRKRGVDSDDEEVEQSSVHLHPSKKSSKIHATSKHYSALANTARSPDKRLREPTGSVDQHGLAVVEDSSSCRSDSEPDMSMPGCPAIADSGAMIGTKSSTVVYAAMIGKERSASLLADTSDDDDSDGGGVSSL